MVKSSVDFLTKKKKDLFIIFYVYELFAYIYAHTAHACLMPTGANRESEIY